jgi:hypothetical protein
MLRMPSLAHKAKRPVSAERLGGIELSCEAGTFPLLAAFSWGS